MTPIVKLARVLVGMDFDEASGAALRVAASLAQAWQAEVTLFHSEPDDVPAYFTTRQIDALESERQERRAATTERLRDFAAPHATRATVLVGNGPPQDAILRLAPQYDLIVVGTHGRHGAQRWWLGSVAEAVAGHSSQPVLVVPASVRLLSASRAPNILVVGSGVPLIEGWADTLRVAFGGRVLHAPSLDHCSPDRLREADVIVFPLGAGSNHAHVKEVAHLLQECVRPVLFVPHPEEPLQRRSS